MVTITVGMMIIIIHQALSVPPLARSTATVYADYTDCHQW